MINAISYNTNIDTYAKPNNVTNPIAFAARLQQRLGEATQDNVVAKADDPSLKDPYDINQGLNHALDSSAQRQADRQQIEQEARSFMFSAAYGQHQKAMLEQYIVAASNNEPASSSPSLKPYEMYQNIQEQQENIRDAKVVVAQQFVESARDTISIPEQPQQLLVQPEGLINVYA
ncbi:hypothetical protein [Oceanicoccus sagamiensis]|uniref:Uncharacterized protein n=1 Tax=Oceanicoccus sagamiensis TaxID=716816 RepID=A0A1X9N4Z5_9GAMM|nr:hypothetical protein [Oceanicoccus sagamiensis]ARN73198.1 hypothetical protein BST96_03200 [Oceanicoccus sagamiensis]